MLGESAGTFGFLHVLDRSGNANMSHDQLRAHRRLLGGMTSQLVSKVLQARRDGAQLVLVVGDWQVVCQRRMGMVCGFGLLVLDSLDSFGECRAAADVMPLVIGIIVAGRV